MQNNVNVRMGMPRYPNPQPRMIRPVVNFNYIPSNNNNNFHDQGSMQRYPAPGITFRNRAPMYHQPVYQHPAENYQQPYMNDQFSGYYEQESTAHSQTWSESDYFQYLNQRDAQSRMISQNNYPAQQFSQVDHAAMFLQRTAATAPQVVRQPMVAANQKRNANTAFNASQQSQKNSKNAGGIAKVPRRQNQPMAMLPAPKPVNHHTNNKPSVQKKPYTIPLKQQQQKVQSEANGKQKQTQLQMTQQSQSSEVIKKEFAYKGKVERDRAIVGTIPQLIKWRSVRHKIPPVYGTVGIVTRRSNMTNEKLKIDDQFILSNLEDWICHDGSSELMECVVYSSEHRQQVFPIGQCVRIVGRFIPDSELFQVLKIRLADESDVNYLSSSLNKSLPFKPDNSYLDRSLPAPSTFEASYEEPEKTTTESYQHLQTTPAPVADTDYLFQPY